MAAKDGRISVIKEVLARVKHIKLYWWQSAFEARVAEARHHELNTFLGLAISEAFLTGIAVLMPMTMTVACLGTYMALGGLLESSRVFPALVILLALGRALNIVPLVMILWQRGAISYGRLQTFLLAEQTDKDDPDRLQAIEGPACINMHNATLGITGDVAAVTKTILRDVNLNIAPGDLAVITGAVGSGKTTIARAVLGDIGSGTGQVDVCGRIAYAPQKPFLINGTIRENILFGLPFDPVFYDKVVDAVCLRQDLLLMPEGDETLLGGIGPSLSGGQQSRVGLARAVYSRREIQVLDDPLAAVDAKVQRKLIDNVLGPNGILKDNIRFVTSSNNALMRVANKLYLIKDETIGECTPSAVQSPALEECASKGFVEGVELPEPLEADGYGTMGTVPFVPVAAVDAGETVETTPLIQKKVESKELPDEVGAKGVRLETYMGYLQTGKPWGWFLVIHLASASVVLTTLGVYFLKQSSEEFEHSGHSSKLWLYALCGVVGAGVEMLFIATAYYRCLIPASEVLHAGLTHGVLRSKFAFFDKTPMGQILNRFTNDINQIDGPVSGGFILLVINTIAVLSSLLVIAITSTILTIPFIPLAVAYYFIQKFYMDTCRQLRRLENHARGPILNIVGEITTGASVIQAYEQHGLFQTRARHMIDEHVRIWAPSLSLEPWLQLRLQLLSW
jgi:ATP-binding cassette, subfamily C (CFTR/MRP), member 1